MFKTKPTPSTQPTITTLIPPRVDTAEDTTTLDRGGHSQQQEETKEQEIQIDRIPSTLQLAAQSISAQQLEPQ